MGAEKVKLSKRLTAVAGLITPAARVCDIGCDHGFVSIYLVQNGIAGHVVACDVNEGPLAGAREHIESYGLSHVIELRLADGMDAITPEDAIGAAVIAGMGGRTMIHILENAIRRGILPQELILQPQSEWKEVRGFLQSAGYRIAAEDMVLEDGKYYVMMRAEASEEKVYIKQENGEADSLEDWFGPCLLRDKHPVLKQYLEKEIAKFSGISETIGKEHEKYPEIQKKLYLLRAAYDSFLE